MKKEYEINDGTLAVISLKDGNSKILEDNQNYIVSCSSFDILDHSCKYFGSSYLGRKEGSKSMIGASYKLPIVIEDSRDIVFFPTSSPEDSECIWIAVNKIVTFNQEKYNTTKIIFENGIELIVPLSYRSVENQIYRATRLTYLLKTHKSNNRNRI